MATIVQNEDATLTVTLTEQELSTLAGIIDQLEAYVTLWLEEKAKVVFQERFAQLSPEDQATVMAMFAP